AALTTHIPLADEREIGFVVEGGNPNEFHWADNAVVDDSYFQTMRIPLLRGRRFGPQDTQHAPYAAVINLAMARRFWPNADPVGKGLFWGNRHLRIVGVVGDVQIKSLDTQPGPMVYNSVYQVESGATSSAVFVMRTGEDFRRITDVARKIIWSVDGGLPVFSTVSMEAIVESSLAERRFTMLLLAAFAVVALGLAVVGLYGVLSYAVTERTPELGMRLALGAEPRKLLWLVINDGVRLVLTGIALGAIGGGVLALSMSRLLFEIRSLDAISFMGAAAVLLLTALLASLVPGLRAARVDPMTALRCE
ncbi:MAG: ABC transporter permease, partial [Acidobacteriaceae bacterium]|nr:ABC transporter permease [Acidobacteriaceae bacterium]